MITIPKNTILQSKGLGDTIGDIVGSFNLDLNSNYGAVRSTRTKKVTVSDGTLDKALGFDIFLGDYYFVCDNYVYRGGEQPGDAFTQVYNETGINEANQDIKVFNGAIYTTFSDTVGKVSKSTNGTSWSTVISSGLIASSPHLFETFIDRLYVTDNFTKVRSISSGDSLTADGDTYNIVLTTDTNWTITTLKEVGNLLYIGLLNTNTGKGRVYSWDGSASIPNSKYDLPAGVVAGTVLDNVFYIMDTQGILKRFAGNSFIEVARLPKSTQSFFQGATTSSNTRYIHPNGMQVTDRGTIMILLSNQIGNTGTYDDTVPAGIWEYNSNVGLYHRYSPSVSSTSVTTFEDFGQTRISSAGALFVSKPAIASLTDNGNIIFGAKYFTGSSVTAFGLFCDDSLDTTQKYGTFTTAKIFGNIQEQWQKVYALYKKFTNSSSEIIIKYRTEEDTPTESTVTWTDMDRFTSSVSLAAYEVGDEIQILQGVGSGFTAHILSTDGTTYIIDEQLPSACIGLTGKVNVSKWRKVGTGKVTYLDKEQFKALTISEKNTSPFIQFKVCMKFNGKDELNKLQIISKEQVSEK